MSKEELSYRALYQHALTLEKERLLLEESTSEEARRKTNESFRNRAAAMEKYHMEQVSKSISTLQYYTAAAATLQTEAAHHSQFTHSPLPFPLPLHHSSSCSPSSWRQSGRRGPSVSVCRPLWPPSSRPNRARSRRRLLRRSRISSIITRRWTSR